MRDALQRIDKSKSPYRAGFIYRRLQGFEMFSHRENCRSSLITPAKEPQGMFRSNLSRHWCACYSTLKRNCLCVGLELICACYVESCISKCLHTGMYFLLSRSSWCKFKEKFEEKVVIQVDKKTETERLKGNPHTHIVWSVLNVCCSSITLNRHTDIF